ncbi:MAG: hypothetical protein H7336_12840 [Bacteriovorax sp.]|nr:hypothetical protein [Bacteriovorax sp.]
MSPAIQEEKLQKKIAADEAIDKVYKLKNNIWNKIISTREFENFNDKEYFRWMEIYKDAKNDLSNVNPVSIEQKMALIEVINGRIIPTVMNAERNLSVDVQKLNSLKLLKLQRHMKNFDLSSKLTRMDLNDFAADLLIILKGPPTSLLEYFTTNKTARMNERLMRIVQEDMLLIGLKGMISRIPEKKSYTQMEKAKYAVKKIFQYKVWKYLVLPYDLPWVERVKIPDELLEKILIDGLDAHDHELISYLKQQNMIDHYERFRKVYKPLAFSVGFYFYYSKFNNSLSGDLNENQEEEKKKFLEDFSNLADSIKASADSTIKSDDTLQNEQFERVLARYRKDFNEDPSPEEYREMKIKIFRN